MSSAICFNLKQSKILSSCNKLKSMFSLLLKLEVKNDARMLEHSRLLYRYLLFTLSQTTNFRLSQTQRVCRRRFQIRLKWQKVFQIGRKPCGKRRNCSLRAISTFPTVFSKDLSCKHVKTRACLGKG